MDLLQHVKKLLRLNEEICVLTKNNKIIPYSQLYSNKLQAYKKVFRSISDYRNLPKNDRQLVNNMFLALKEFLLKSVDYTQLNIENSHDLMQLILQLNKLIAFSFDDTINAGLRNLRSIETHTKFITEKFASFKSEDFNIQWNIVTLKPTICFLDVFLHTFKLLNYKPFKAYNVHTAFAWGWMIERYCVQHSTLKFQMYMPWLTWVYESLVTNNFCKGGVDFCLSNYLELALEYLLSLKKEYKQLDMFSKYNLNKRQMRALKYIQHYGSISRSEYSKITKTSFMTAFRDLKGLVQLGILASKGASNKTRYLLKISERLSS